MVGNGLRLRLLRDNQALSRQSFLEFDLEAMFDGEVYLGLRAALADRPRDPLRPPGRGPAPGDLLAGTVDQARRRTGHPALANCGGALSGPSRSSARASPATPRTPPCATPAHGHGDAGRLPRPAPARRLPAHLPVRGRGSRRSTACLCSTPGTTPTRPDSPANVTPRTTAPAPARPGRQDQGQPPR